MPVPHSWYATKPNMSNPVAMSVLPRLPTHHRQSFGAGGRSHLLSRCPRPSRTARGSDGVDVAPRSGGDMSGGAGGESRADTELKLVVERALRLALRRLFAFCCAWAPAAPGVSFGR